jgi:hypothetical protein
VSRIVGFQDLEPVADRLRCVYLFRPDSCDKPVTGIDIHVTSTSGDPIEGVLVIPGGGFWLPITDKTGLFHLEVLQISSPFVTRDINPYCFGNEEGSILALGRSTSVICSRI